MSGKRSSADAEEKESPPTRAAEDASCTLPVDGLGFSRRECPHCHRVFKIRGGGSVAVLRLVAGHAAHANLEEIPPGLVRYCPYCAATGPEGAWLTAPQRAYLEHLAKHLWKSVRYGQLSLPRATLGSNPYLTFLPVPPAPFEETLPPEPDDLRVVPLVCCREEMKVSDSWGLSLVCHLCGARHLVERAAPGLLQRLGFDRYA